jgi:hypothetical protein
MFECGKNNQFKTETEFITGPKNDEGKNHFKIQQIQIYNVIRYI